MESKAQLAKKEIRRWVAYEKMLAQVFNAGYEIAIGRNPENLVKKMTKSVKKPA